MTRSSFARALRASVILGLAGSLFALVPNARADAPTSALGPCETSPHDGGGSGLGLAIVGLAIGLGITRARARRSQSQ